MRIPVRDPNQVPLNPVSGYQAQSTYVKPASVSGAVAGALGEINDTRERWRKHFDGVRVEESVTALQGFAGGLQNEYLGQLGGSVVSSDGRPFAEGYLDRFDKEVDRIGGGLNNHEQRSAFTSKASALRQQLQYRIEKHEGEQLLVHADDVDASTIETERQNARQAYADPLARGTSFIRIGGAVESFAKRHGWSKEKTSIERQKEFGNVHASILEAAMEAKDTDFAKAYLDQHGDEMTSTARAKAAKLVEGMIVDKGALSIARTALDAARASGLSKATGYEIIDKAAGDNVELRDKAMTEFEHGLAVYRDEQKTKADQEEASIYDMVMRKQSPSDVFHAIRGLKTLDEKDKVKLQGEISKLYRGDAEDRAEAREDRREQRAAALLRYELNPGLVWQMSEEDILKKMPELGAEGVTKLAGMKKQMQTTGPQSFQVDADTFNAIAEEAGIKTKAQGNTQKLLKIKSLVEAQIDEEQRASSTHPNRKIDAERRKEIMRYWFSNVLVSEKGKVKERPRWDVEDPVAIVRAIPPERMGAIVAYLERQSTLANRKQAITLADLTPEEIVRIDSMLGR